MQAGCQAIGCMANVSNLSASMPYGQIPLDHAKPVLTRLVRNESLTGALTQNSKFVGDETRQGEHHETNADEEFEHIRVFNINLAA
jgi:hypothetical protein